MEHNAAIYESRNSAGVLPGIAWFARWHMGVVIGFAHVDDCSMGQDDYH